ncbi:MAG TPA: hypothetical protein VK670_01805 [Silvibacterium sp.]|nr:hypothetical protein [Silvibacterium sp.]
MTRIAGARPEVKGLAVQAMAPDGAGLTVLLHAPSAQKHFQGTKKEPRLAVKNQRA